LHDQARDGFRRHLLNLAYMQGVPVGTRVLDLGGLNVNGTVHVLDASIPEGGLVVVDL
jgi:hypothetical protein